MRTESVVIELGVPSDEPPAGSTSTRRSPARPLRTALAALAAGLLLAAGGSVPAPAPAVREVAVLPNTPLQHRLLDGSRLYTVALEFGTPSHRVSAHALDQGPLLWTVLVPGGGADLARWGRPGMDLRLVGDDLLVTGADTTTALEAATGRLRWSIDQAVLQPHADGVGYSSTNVFPPDAGDPGVADGGTFYVGSDGRMYDQPPLGTVLRGIDLAVGTELWTSPMVRFGWLVHSAPTPVLAVVTLDDALELWDGRTGAVRFRRVLGHGVNSMVTDRRIDLVAVLDDTGTLTGYAADTLEPRWRTAVDPNFVHACADYLCSTADGDTALIDPGTGQVLSRLPPGEVRSMAGHLMLVDHAFAVARTVDPHTGRTAIELGDWRPLSEEWSGSGPLLARYDLDGRRYWFAVLDPGASAPRPIGSVPQQGVLCQSSATHIVCQTSPTELRAWSYR